MNSVLVVIVALIALAIGLFVFKTISEKKAKESYKPPVAKEKYELPEPPSNPMRVESADELMFCEACGTANRSSAKFCLNCGKPFNKNDNADGEEG